MKRWLKIVNIGGGMTLLLALGIVVVTWCAGQFTLVAILSSLFQQDLPHLPEPYSLFRDDEGWVHLTRDIDDGPQRLWTIVKTGPFRQSQITHICIVEERWILAHVNGPAGDAYALIDASKKKELCHLDPDMFAQARKEQSVPASIEWIEVGVAPK